MDFPMDKTGYHAMERHSTENSKQILPEKELLGLSPNFHIHVYVSDCTYSHNWTAYSVAGK
jgi:hypothetical protein